jgi:transposase-like protein
LIDNYVIMSKYTALIQDLESSTESFNQLAKRHGHKTSIAHAALSKIRPDLLGPRSARLGFAPVNKTDIPDNVRAEALTRVLAGESVKDVAQATGVPAPTLYQMVRKAREKEAAKATDNVTLAAGGSAALNAQDSAIISLLAASLNAASAQMGKTPAQVLTMLTAYLHANA